MAEKRRGTRVAPRELEPVEVQIMGEGFLDILHAKDIGESGISLFVPPHYSSAQSKKEVTLIIAVPGFRSFEAGGVIRHTGIKVHERNRRCFGIQFTKIAPEHQKLLDNYVKKRLADNRKHVRVEPASREPISAEVITSSKKEPLEIKDISLGGALAVNPSVAKTCRPEEDVEFLISTPGGEKIKVIGNLRHSDQSTGYFGLCFRDLTQDQIDILKRYIARRVVQKQQEIDSIR